MKSSIQHHGTVTLSGNKKQVKRQLAYLLKSGGIFALKQRKFKKEKICLLADLDLFSASAWQKCFSYFDEKNGTLRFNLQTNRPEFSAGRGILNRVACAASVLCDLSSQTFAFSELSNVDIGEAIGWLNYLFKTDFKPVYRTDLWQITEMILREDTGAIKDPSEIIGLPRMMKMLPAQNQFPVDHVLEALAAAAGIDALQNYFEAKQEEDCSPFKNLSAYNVNALFHLKPVLQMIFKENADDPELLLNQIVDFLALDDRQQKLAQEQSASLGLIYFYLKDSSAIFILEALAEVFNRDFWQLYLAYRARASKPCKYKRPNASVEPLSTAEFLDLLEIEQIPFLSENTFFSSSLTLWFDKLKERVRLLRRNFRPCTDQNEFTDRLFVLIKILETDCGLFLFENTFNEFLTQWMTAEIQILLELLRQIITENREEILRLGKKNTPHTRRNFAMERRYYPARMHVKAFVALLANQPLRYSILEI